eukprot:g5004.t1
MHSPLSSKSSAYDPGVNGMSYTTPVLEYLSLDHTKAQLRTLEYCYNGTSICQPGFGRYTQVAAIRPWDMNSLKAAIYHAEAKSGQIAKIISSCAFKPREAAFTKIISICGRWKCSEKAFEVFEAMVEKRGLFPNTITYTALLSACIAAGDFDSAMDAFHKMKIAAITDPSCQPNEVTYNRVITASEESGKYAFAINCFHETETRGVEVDRAVYYSVLNACLKTESWEEAERVLSIMHGKGFAATLENYSAMIKHYGKNDEAQTAADLFITMQEMNQYVDEHCRHTLMNAFELANYSEMAEVLLNCIWEEKFRAKLSTYVSALRVFALKGQKKPPLTIFKRMVPDYDVMIPEEAKNLILTAAKAFNQTEIEKRLDNFFSNEVNDGEGSSAFLA